MPKDKDIEVTRSSGNVFADLGVEQPTEALIKAQIAAVISSVIEHRHLTQKQAAEILGVDQPKVSALTCGRLSGFSLERLFRFMSALGRDVDIVIKKRGPARRVGTVRVVASR
jgi:predicted XRE-type DNA-binding protein